MRRPAQGIFGNIENGVRNARETIVARGIHRSSGKPATGAGKEGRIPAGYRIRVHQQRR